MHNRLLDLFQKKNKNVLSVFFTAGYPALENTVEIMQLIQSSGADIIEIGMPFSDPLADGPVIQNSSEKALQNGMSIGMLFEQIRKFRKLISIPVVLMGYLNPVMKFGMHAFMEQCKVCGIDGVILPDLPPDVYQKNYQSIFEENNLSNIFLITPSTPQERIKQIDQISTGFLYLVSSPGTTGKAVDFLNEDYKTIQSLSLRNPVLIGFGINNKENFNIACEYSNGAIIGSAFIRSIADGDLKKNIPAFINSILN